jgi:predicted enzyme related to lactoylglutathione lyase
VAVMSGKVVHFEIPFDDGDRARGFYKEVFDWQLVTMPEMGGYTLVTSGPSGDQGPTEPGFINGGMLARDGAMKGPLIVVDVDSIDASLAKIGELGGTTVSPKAPVGDMGFAAYFTDPEGNVIGLWETVKA